MTSDIFSSVPHAGILIAATSSKSSGSSSVFLILIVVLFGVYFLWLRPQRNRIRAQQAQRQEPVVGDEVVTTGGIIGRVRKVETDRADIEVSPGQVITVHRSALGRRLEPALPSDDVAPSREPEPSEDSALHEDDASARDGEPAGGWWPNSSEEPHGSKEDGE